MKKLLASLLLISVSLYSQEVAIIDYEPAHKDAAMEIFFQDPLLFFPGSRMIEQGYYTVEHFNEMNRAGMELLLDDPLRVKRVIIDAGKVVGFIDFFKTQEVSLESVIKQATLAQNFTPEQERLFEEQFIKMMPQVKKTDEECQTFAKIESVAVSRDFRRRGHARAMIKYALEYIKEHWPMIARVELDVNADNEHARKLYESEGFKLSAFQPSHLSLIDTVQYEKDI